VNEGPGNNIIGAKKNAPATADEPPGSRGALLAAHARTLDSRLRVAAQNDRQATRRAAAHVVQLARRIARLLPRVPTLLPVLPEGGRDARVRHYVLKAQPALGTQATRILTISTHSVLRYGEFDGSGKPVLWNEYDPLQPVAGWELETVLERLAEVLVQITEQVELLEARVAERATALNSLLHSAQVNNRPLGIPPVPGPLRPKAVLPMATPLRALPPAAAASQGFAIQPLAPLPETSAEPHPELDESMPELALIDLAFGEPPAEYDMPAPAETSEEAEGSDDVFPVLAADEGIALPPSTGAQTVDDATADATTDAAAEAAAESQKRERRFFQHLRVR